MFIWGLFSDLLKRKEREKRPINPNVYWRAADAGIKCNKKMVVSIQQGRGWRWFTFWWFLQESRIKREVVLSIVHVLVVEFSSRVWTHKFDDFVVLESLWSFFADNDKVQEWNGEHLLAPSSPQHIWGFHGAWDNFCFVSTFKYHKVFY